MSVELRGATLADRPGVLELMSACLGWHGDDRHERLFQWKHDDNPFGVSPGWVAIADGRVVGFRTFMRWEFLTDGGICRAARAVDTATAPDHQGKGIFRDLTTLGIEALAAEGVELIFNTPNDQSRPGYLKMGWEVVGRLPVSIRPTGPRGFARIARARVPAEIWSEPGGGGVPADQRLAAIDAAARAAAITDDRPGRWATNRTSAFRRWRYGLGALDYRVVEGKGSAPAVAVYRRRRRGPALEATVVDVLAGSGRAEASVLRRAGRAAGADHVIWMGGRSSTAALRTRRLGPILTARSLGARAIPPLEHWALTLGDMELF